MASIKKGYWDNQYWPNNYWSERYWPGFPSGRSKDPRRWEVDEEEFPEPLDVKYTSNILFNLGISSESTFNRFIDSKLYTITSNVVFKSNVEELLFIDEDLWLIDG